MIPDLYKQEFKIRMGAPHMFWSIANLKKNGLDAKVIIDIGAYKGDWTKEVLKIYPCADYLLVEANPEREPDLEKFVNSNRKNNISYEIALLGSQSGIDQTFNLTDTASSALEEHSANGFERIVLKTKTLNEIIAEREVKEISLVKLDVQGYELEILKGGSLVLEIADAILLEVSLLDIHKNVPLIKEVICFMDDFGFVVYDICSVSSRRPRDRALWQTDLLFVRHDSIFRSDKSYY